MGEQIGGIMGAFKGPEAQGIQPTPTGGGGGYAPTANTSALVTEPPGTPTMPSVSGAAGSDDGLRRLSNQLALANGVASMGRGLYSDLARGGPQGGSPIAPMARGGGQPYQASALKLSDILARRR